MLFCQRVKLLEGDERIIIVWCFRHSRRFRLAGMFGRQKEK
ncbi:MAG TPA: hypothetical protein VKU38_05485 [Ktedonobacteraceae bacterium]|nr:hypothetical protein [Ktedonobacteraceae bacterium]